MALAENDRNNQMNYLCATLMVIFCTPYGWTGMGIFFIGLYALMH